MKLSIFTTYTDPEKRNDPWKEALNCFNDIADEVIVTGSDWPEEFTWSQIGKYFQQGLNESKVTGIFVWILITFFMRKM